VFGFVPLSATQLAAVVVVVLGYILATEVAKVWYFRSGRST
jgi:Mg2+-importing ATPase